MNFGVSLSANINSNTRSNIWRRNSNFTCVYSTEIDGWIKCISNQSTRDTWKPLKTNFGREEKSVRWKMKWKHICEPIFVRRRDIWTTFLSIYLLFPLVLCARHFCWFIAIFSSSNIKTRSLMGYKQGMKWKKEIDFVHTLFIVDFAHTHALLHVRPRSEMRYVALIDLNKYVWEAFLRA